MRTYRLATRITTPRHSRHSALSSGYIYIYIYIYIHVIPLRSVVATLTAAIFLSSPAAVAPLWPINKKAPPEFSTTGKNSRPSAGRSVFLPPSSSFPRALSLSRARARSGSLMQARLFYQSLSLLPPYRARILRELFASERASL